MQILQYLLYNPLFSHLRHDCSLLVSLLSLIYFSQSRVLYVTEFVTAIKKW